jgi:hypothetical protein
MGGARRKAGPLESPSLVSGSSLGVYGFHFSKARSLIFWSGCGSQNRRRSDSQALEAWSMAASFADRLLSTLYCNLLV